jgi:hypothetical protein
VLKDIVPSKRSSVIALEEEAFGIGKTGSGNNPTQVAQKIADAIEDANPPEGSWLLLNKDLSSSTEKLRNRWIEVGQDETQCLSLKPEILIKRLGNISKSLKIHWRDHALTQIGKFQNQTTDLDDWCRQFFDLGVGHIGRRIAMRLEVVEYGGFAEPFEPKLHERVGQSLLHCYVQDEDTGGSWKSISDHLAHTYPSHLIEPIPVKDHKLIVPKTNADEIVIYEDGLWSGSETVKRLQKLATDPIDTPLRLRFAITTDFGLMVARQAVRHFNLQGRVVIDPNNARFEQFVTPDIPSALERGEGMEPRTYFKELHKHVVESVFCDPGDWPEGFEESREVTKLLGQQLVRHWYKTDRPDDDPDDGAEKFGLGGGGFAASIAFPRSVPKICLPLLWLAGPVEHNGKSLNWCPLFKDVRRVGSLLMNS